MFYNDSFEMFVYVFLSVTTQTSNADGLYGWWHSLYFISTSAGADPLFGGSGGTRLPPFYSYWDTPWNSQRIQGSDGNLFGLVIIMKSLASTNYQCVPVQCHVSCSEKIWGHLCSVERDVKNIWVAVENDV